MGACAVILKSIALVMAFVACAGVGFGAFTNHWSDDGTMYVGLLGGDCRADDKQLFHNETHRQQMHDACQDFINKAPWYRITTIVLLGLAILLGLVSIVLGICSCVGCCLKEKFFIVGILEIVAVFLTFGGIGLFLFKNQADASEYTKELGSTAESLGDAAKKTFQGKFEDLKTAPYSLIAAIIGGIFHLIAAILGFLAQCCGGKEEGGNE